jgi:hypothetical protein
MSSVPLGVTSAAAAAISAVAAMAAMTVPMSASAVAAVVTVPVTAVMTGHRAAVRRATGPAAEVARAARTAARRTEPVSGKVATTTCARRRTAPVAEVVAPAARSSRGASPAAAYLIRSHPPDHSIGCRGFAEDDDQSLPQSTDVRVAQVDTARTSGPRPAVRTGTIVSSTRNAPKTAKSSEAAAARAEPAGTTGPETKTTAARSETAAGESAATTLAGTSKAAAGRRAAAIAVRVATITGAAPIGLPGSIVRIAPSTECAAAGKPATAARPRAADSAAGRRTAAIVVRTSSVALFAQIVTPVRPPRFVGVAPAPVVAAVTVIGALAGRRPAVRLIGPIAVGSYRDGQCECEAAPQTRSPEFVHGQLLELILVEGLHRRHTEKVAMIRP